MSVSEDDSFSDSSEDEVTSSHGRTSVTSASLIAFSWLKMSGLRRFCLCVSVTFSSLGISSSGNVSLVIVLVSGIAPFSWNKLQFIICSKRSDISTESIYSLRDETRSIIREIPDKKGINRKFGNYYL